MELIHEDWEHEFHKNFIYLQEDIEELKSQIYPLVSTQEVAKIVVVDKDGILESLKNGRKNRLISLKGITEK